MPRFVGKVIVCQMVSAKDSGRGLFQEISYPIILSAPDGRNHVSCSAILATGARNIQADSPQDPRRILYLWSVSFCAWHVVSKYVVEIKGGRWGHAHDSLFAISFYFVRSIHVALILSY